MCSSDLVLGNATVKVGRSLISGVTMGAETLKGDLLSVAVTGADLFIGTGATFDATTGLVTLPAETSTTAVGFRVSGGTLNLGVFTSREKLVSGSYTALEAANTLKYTGLKGSLGSARLQGVDAVKIVATRLTFQMNRTSAADGVLMDWTQTALAGTGVGLTPDDVPFQIGGTVGLSIADVVMGSATLDMTRGPVSGVVIPGSDVATQGTLLTLAVNQANLYIGNGATFDLDSKSATFGTVVLPASNDPTAVGFAVENGAFKIAVLTVGSGATAKK